MLMKKRKENTFLVALYNIVVLVYISEAVRKEAMLDFLDVIFHHLTMLVHR